MRAQAFDLLDWQPYPGQRVGSTQYKCLLRGEAGAADNYELFMTHYGSGGSQSPRHRHNFDQFRWAVKDPLNFSADRNIPSGQLGYFPEGAHYGPQRSSEGNEMLILQFGGASGHGYLHNNQLMQGTGELKEIGEFNKGVFTYYDTTGRKFNKDAYEAVWEHVSKRKIEYPTPRFDVPIIINPEAYNWTASEDSGTQVRHFGTFNERGTSAFQYRFGEGSTCKLSAEPNKRLLIVLSGSLIIEDKRYGPLSAIEIMAGSEGSLHASEETQLLGIGLPSFQ